MRERERERERGGGGDRDREKEGGQAQKRGNQTDGQKVCTQLHARMPDWLYTTYDSYVL